MWGENIFCTGIIIRMIDKLSLTSFAVPNSVCLFVKGEVTEDVSRSHLYRYIWRLPRATVLYCPHKFGDKTNARIPFTKIDINPKYFECYNEMVAYLSDVLEDGDRILDVSNVTRVDIAADIEGLSVDVIMSMLRIRNIRLDSISFYKGTFYAGSDPKIRIYDKVKEIKARIRKGEEMTSYEKGLLESGKSYTRFEVQIRNVKKTLHEIADDPVSLAAYYDRLQFFDFQGKNDSGVLPFFYKYVNRKFRGELDKYRNNSIVDDMKGQYKESVLNWFDSGREPF